MLCKTCKTKPTCKAICGKVNEYMKKQGIYSADYIRPRMSSNKREDGNIWREIPFSSLKKKPDLGWENFK